jgi:hypothetical protein
VRSRDCPSRRCRVTRWWRSPGDGVLDLGFINGLAIDIKPDRAACGIVVEVSDAKNVDHFSAVVEVRDLIDQLLHPEFFNIYPTCSDNFVLQMRPIHTKQPSSRSDIAFRFTKRTANSLAPRRPLHLF